MANYLGAQDEIPLHIVILSPMLNELQGNNSANLKNFTKNSGFFTKNSEIFTKNLEIFTKHISFFTKRPVQSPSRQPGGVYNMLLLCKQ